MHAPILTTDRLILRKPAVADLAPYTAYCQSERSRHVHGPFTADQAFDKLAAMIGHWESRGFGRFVFTDRLTARAIGHVGVLQVDPAGPPEITWTIWSGKDAGKGYALEATKASLDHAAHALGFRTLIARIAPDNAPSRRLAKKLGAVLDPAALPPDRFPGSLTYRLA